MVDYGTQTELLGHWVTESLYPGVNSSLTFAPVSDEGVMPTNY